MSNRPTLYTQIFVLPPTRRVATNGTIRSSFCFLFLLTTFSIPIAAYAQTTSDSTGTPEAKIDPLAIAKNLADIEFKDWTYGSNRRNKQIDCVQFLLAVVEKAIAPTELTSEQRQAILIANLSEEEKKQENLSKLILQGDKRTKGVQEVLVQLKKGEVVSPEKAEPGDLIQYWMKRNDGTWYGHAGIIESVENEGTTPRARLFGAHQRSNGIATSSFSLRLISDSDDRRIYIVRMK